MSELILKKQISLLDSRERIYSLLKKYNCFINVGVGLKEKDSAITDIICYRTYVSKKILEMERITTHMRGILTAPAINTDVVFRKLLSNSIICFNNR